MPLRRDSCPIVMTAAGASVSLVAVIVASKRTVTRPARAGRVRRSIQVIHSGDPLRPRGLAAAGCLGQRDRGAAHAMLGGPGLGGIGAPEEVDQRAPVVDDRRDRGAAGCIGVSIRGGGAAVG